MKKIIIIYSNYYNKKLCYTYLKIYIYKDFLNFYLYCTYFNIYYSAELKIKINKTTATPRQNELAFLVF